MLLELIGILCVLGLFSACLYLNYKHWQYRHIPGPVRESFIFGNSHVFRKFVQEEGVFCAYHLECCRKYGTVFVFWMVHKPVVFVADPAIIKEIVTDSKTFRRADVKNGYVSLNSFGSQRFCGNNSILTDHGGPIWKKKKRIMDPVFSIQKLTSYLPRFYTISKNVTDAMAETMERNSVVDIRAVFAPFTIDAISSAGFSASVEKQKELQSGNRTLEKCMIDNVQKGANWFTMMFNSEQKKNLKVAMESLKLTRNIGKGMIYDRTSNGTYGQINDVLDHIITANMDEITGSLDLEECLDDFMTMYAAGNATTLTTVSWTVQELVRNPHVMSRLVDEVDEFWADINDDSDAKTIAETLKNMKYLDAVVKEVLRFHPPVVLSVKQNTCRNQIGGYIIPANTMIMTSQYVMHRLEKYWDNGDIFDPEHFIDKSPKPYTYFPFQLGPRQCIGKNFAILELKCMICEMLKRFEVTRAPNTPDKIKSSQAILCIPQDCLVNIIPRY